MYSEITCTYLRRWKGEIRSILVHPKMTTSVGNVSQFAFIVTKCNSPMKIMIVVIKRAQLTFIQFHTFSKSFTSKYRTLLLHSKCHVGISNQPRFSTQLHRRKKTLCHKHVRFHLKKKQKNITIKY